MVERGTPGEGREPQALLRAEGERTFVGNPVTALEMADRTVSGILRERNFPTGGQNDFDGAAESIGIFELGVAGDYREAQGIRNE